MLGKLMSTSVILSLIRKMFKNGLKQKHQPNFVNLIEPNMKTLAYDITMGNSSFITCHNFLIFKL